MEVLGRNRFVLLCCAALTAAPGLWLPIHGQTAAAANTAPVSRDTIYAAFLLNLTRFVRWPENVFSAADAPFVIGTFNQDPITPVLREIVSNEKIDRRPIVSRALTSLDDVKSCHVVFVSGSDAKRLNAVMALCREKPILMVTDVSGFAEIGGHVMLDSSASRIRLRISTENLKQSHLLASSQLLRLAEIVNR